MRVFPVPGVATAALCQPPAFARLSNLPPHEFKRDAHEDSNAQKSNDYHSHEEPLGAIGQYQRLGKLQEETPILTSRNRLELSFGIQLNGRLGSISFAYTGNCRAPLICNLFDGLALN
jgi:hypothetical protein